MSVDPDRLERASSEAFLAGSGPGGQNANKVATVVQLRIDCMALGLPLATWRRLKRLAGSRLTEAGELIIVAREHRTREANRTAARERALDLIERAGRPPARRIATRPSRAAKARRADAKSRRGAVKRGRGPVPAD